MNINLFGIQTSPGGRALFASAWEHDRGWLLLSIVAKHVKWIVLMALAVLASVGLSILTLPFGDTDLMARYVGGSGLNYAVIYQETVKWAVVAYGVAVLATPLDIMRRFYQAAGLGYSSFRQFDIDSRPELRLALLKFQQKDMAKAEQRGGAPE